MSKLKKCGPKCFFCDCGRSSNRCKFYKNKVNGFKKMMGLK